MTDVFRIGDLVRYDYAAGVYLAEVIKEGLELPGLGKVLPDLGTILRVDSGPAYTEEEMESLQEAFGPEVDVANLARDTFQVGSTMPLTTDVLETDPIGSAVTLLARAGEWDVENLPEPVPSYRASV